MMQYGDCFFFNDPPTTEISTLSLHDALPISSAAGALGDQPQAVHLGRGALDGHPAERAGEQAAHGLDVVVLRDLHAEQLGEDRKSTRLNSSHANISYAVFCLKKKNIN